MDNRDLYKRAVEGTKPLESKETSERLLQKQELIRQRIQALFERAKSQGYPGEEIVVERNVTPDSRAGAVDVVKRSFTVSLPAGAEFQALAAPECDLPSSDDYPDVVQHITIGVHDLLIHDDNGHLAATRSAQSCDIVTALSVTDPATNALIQPHSFNDVVVLERLNMDYPVFPSPESRLGTGSSEQQLYQPIEVTPEMEYDAATRWRQESEDHCLEAILCSLDKIEEALKRFEQGD